MDANDIATTIRSIPMTAAMNAMKDAGKTPIATVMMEKGEVRQVSLTVDGVDYFFHDTKDHNGKRLLIRQETRGDVSRAEVPFDGWGLSMPETVQA